VEWQLHYNFREAYEAQDLSPKQMERVRIVCLDLFFVSYDYHSYRGYHGYYYSLDLTFIIMIVFLHCILTSTRRMRLSQT